MSKIKGDITIKNPEAQIEAWINTNDSLSAFWEEVILREDWKGLNKTKEQATALKEYFEGRLDMALEFRDFINQKTIEKTDEDNSNGVV